MKTRTERAIPVLPELVQVLRSVVGDRSTGPVFLRRHLVEDGPPTLAALSADRLEHELQRRIDMQTPDVGGPVSRPAVQRVSDRLWYAMGAIKADTIRLEFKRLTASIGLPEAGSFFSRSL